MYYSVLLAVFAYQHWHGGPDYSILYIDGGWLRLAQHLTFRAGDFLLWTMPQEVHYYLVLPVIVLCLQRFGRRAAWPMLSFALVFGLVSFLDRAGIREGLTAHLMRSSPDRCYDLFLMGTLTAFCLDARPRWALGGHPGLSGWAGAALLVATLGVTLVLMSRDFFGLHQNTVFHHLSVLYAVLWPLVVWLVWADTGTATRLLRCRVLRSIGVCGFGWYLLHLVVMKLVNVLSQGTWLVTHEAAKLGITLVLLYFLCLATYAWIERPFLLRAGAGGRVRAVPAMAAEPARSAARGPTRA